MPMFSVLHWRRELYDGLTQTVETEGLVNIPSPLAGAQNVWSPSRVFCTLVLEEFQRNEGTPYVKAVVTRAAGMEPGEVNDGTYLCSSKPRKGVVRRG
jgi:hypothetical protein